MGLLTLLFDSLLLLYACLLALAIWSARTKQSLQKKDLLLFLLPVLLLLLALFVKSWGFLAVALLGNSAIAWLYAPQINPNGQRQSRHHLIRLVFHLVLILLGWYFF